MKGIKGWTIRHSDNHGQDYQCDYCGYPLGVGDIAFQWGEHSIIGCSNTCVRKEKELCDNRGFYRGGLRIFSERS